MPLVRGIQTSGTSGEFDPRLFDRIDTTFAQSAFWLLENCYVLPQGGWAARAGMPTLMRKRNTLEAVSLAGATETAPQGGTAANAIDGDEATLLTTTGALGTVNPYVILHLDFGSTVNPACVDVVDLLVSDGSEASIVLQGSTDDAAWDTIATLTTGLTARSRRVATLPGDTLGGYRYWRLARLGGSDLGSATVSLAEVAFWNETTTLTAGKVFPFTVDSSTEYQFVLTAGHLDVVRTRPAPVEWVASARAPYAAADVLNVKRAQSRDLMLLFHEDHPPYALFRQGGDGQWDWRDRVFDSVTQFAWADEFVSGGVNEKQVVTLTSVASGNTFRFELNGRYTDTITAGASAAATAAAMEAGLETHEDITSVTVTNLAGTAYEIEFDGDDGKKAWPILVPTILTGSGSAEIERSQTGEEDKAPLWDANHGYPRAGTFYQGRLWMTGFRDRSGATVGSRSGEFFDFDLDLEPADSSPLLFEADTDEQVTCHAIHAGRHLQIFSSSGEFYVPSEPITPSNLALKQTSRIGTEPGVPSVDVEGATLYIARNGEALMEYLFVDTEQSYQSNQVSLLASHLVKSPAAVALRRRRDADEPTLYLMANTGNFDDGTRAAAAMVTILRAQQVTAFARWSTPGGTIEGVAATQFGDTLAIVDRTIGGTDYSFVEIWDTDHQLDGGAKVENADVDILSGSGVGPYTYTFSAATAAEVVVYKRDATTGPWELVPATAYTLDLGLKTVTLDADQDTGQVRISKPMTTVTLTSVTDHLDGVALRVVVDGFDQGSVTPSGSVITLPVAADFDVEYGFHFDAQAVPLPYRPETAEGQKLARKGRIPHLAVSVYRTGALSAGLYGQTLKAMNLELPETGVREARLATGTRRMWGIPGWELDAAPHLRRDKAEPLAIRSIVYDLRW